MTHMGPDFLPPTLLTVSEVDKDLFARWGVGFALNWLATTEERVECQRLWDRRLSGLAAIIAALDAVGVCLRDLPDEDDHRYDDALFAWATFYRLAHDDGALEMRKPDSLERLRQMLRYAPPEISEPLQFGITTNYHGTWPALVHAWECFIAA
jgi:hypothetical protein